MTDREQLQLAAKAAGIEWYGMYGDEHNECHYLDIGPEDVVEWNPLTDDGDALRLAVKLGLTVEIWERQVAEIAGRILFNGNLIFITVSNDPYAAARRAIVRAAAEIGKAMP